MGNEEIIEAYKEIVKEQADLISTLNNLVSTLNHELIMATIGKGSTQTNPPLVKHNPSKDKKVE